MPKHRKCKPTDNIEINTYFRLLLLVGRFRELQESKMTFDNRMITHPKYLRLQNRFANILKYIRFGISISCKEGKSKLLDQCLPGFLYSI